MRFVPGSKEDVLNIFTCSVVVAKIHEKHRNVLFRDSLLIIETKRDKAVTKPTQTNPHYGRTQVHI